MLFTAKTLEIDVYQSFSNPFPNETVYDFKKDCIEENSFENADKEMNQSIKIARANSKIDNNAP